MLFRSVSQSRYKEVTTLNEYKKDLIEKEEIELIDLLEITSYDIVERFDDRVEEQWEEEEEDSI